MDATEAQLKFGASLTNSLDLPSSSQSVNPTVSASGEFPFFFLVNFFE